MQKSILPFLFVLAALNIYCADKKSAPVLDTSIRHTNWLEVCRKDPALLVNLERGFGDDEDYEVSVKQDSDVIGGFLPDSESIVYLDLNHDNREDAALLMHSGGTAGFVSVFVFLQTDKGPTFAGYEAGYQLGLDTKGTDTLVMYSALFAPGDGNCCPSGENVYHITYAKNKLRSKFVRTEGNVEAASNSVLRYYMSIDTKEFEAAYDCLSPSYQKAHPYKEWVAGYGNTISTEVDYGEVNTKDTTVEVTIHSTDRIGGPNSTEEGHHTFQGTWEMQWYTIPGKPDVGAWVLTNPKIRKV